MKREFCDIKYANNSEARPQKQKLENSFIYQDNTSNDQIYIDSIIKYDRMRNTCINELLHCNSSQKNEKSFIVIVSIYHVVQSILL